MANVFAILLVDHSQDDPTVRLNSSLEVVGALLVTLLGRLEFLEEVGGNSGQCVLLLYSRVSGSIAILRSFALFFCLFHVTRLATRASLGRFNLTRKLERKV